jgi:hypothetical protein
MTVNNNVFAEFPFWQGFPGENRFKFHSTPRPLHSRSGFLLNGFIESAPEHHAPHASFSRAASDKTLAFLDRQTKR